MSALDVTLELATDLVALCLLMGLYRLWKGPHLADRAMSLDFIGVSSVGFIALLAMRASEPSYLAPGAVIALIGFLGVVSFAHFIERGIDD